MYMQSQVKTISLFQHNIQHSTAFYLQYAAKLNTLVGDKTKKSTVQYISQNGQFLYRPEHITHAGA